MDLAIGTRVRIIGNLCVQLGLYNGAMGTVWGFVYEGSAPVAGVTLQKDFYKESNERELPTILVRMDGTDGNDSMFPYSCSPKVSRLIPISPILSKCRILDDYYRLQYPIMPAHARTGHSVQGMTAYSGATVDPGSQFFAGDYVAISRAKLLAQLLLLHPVLPSNFQKHSKFMVVVDKEYKRLDSRPQPVYS